ncbi:ankyrin repeat domain-containing protein [Fusobacterium varium]|uniref:ankyrin repeat domain-containing protein n=2 Tax=Fusobacterium TaxID=848 RepID=UPI00242A5E0B|nr:ankyrin repeat domain-containing protein [Fusobacterium varium]
MENKKREENLISLTFDSLEEGDIKKAEELFNSGVDIFRVTESKWNWLHQVLMGIPSETPAKTIKYLIDKGVSPIAKDYYEMTPLHYAMRGKNIEAAKILLEAGADPNARDIEGGLIPFKMACCIYPFNKELVELFLQHGANIYITDNTTGETWMDIINATNIEEWRDMKVFMNEYEAKLKAEGKLPPKPKKKEKLANKSLHDGKSEIIVKISDNWLDQYKELWKLLVPKQGKALTVQGEVIRICGKLEHEILDNGRINWDNDFELMCKELRKYLLTYGNLLSEEENQKIKNIILKIKKDTVKEKDFDKLTELCTKWILLNRTPIELREVPYNR